MPPLEEPKKNFQSCFFGKLQKKSYPPSTNSSATKPLELVYGDIYETITPSTLRGSRYYLLLIEDFFILTWIDMLKSKSNAFQSFKNFKKLIEKDKETKIKCFKKNHCGELMFEEFISFVMSKV